MLKKNILNLIKRSRLRKFFLNFAINLNNHSYSLIKKFLSAPGEDHPKHRIVNYKKFFLDNVKEDDVVLDVGCFMGEISFPVAEKVKRVVGIEIDEEKIKKAKLKNNLDNLIFIHGDATVYDFNELGIEGFDKIILSNVLEHIEDRAEFLKKLQKLSDVILLRVPMVDRDWLTVYKKENGYNHFLDPTHYIEYTLDGLKNELNQGGWRLVNYSVQFGETWAIVKKI